MKEPMYVTKSWLNDQTLPLRKMKKKLQKILYKENSLAICANSDLSQFAL